MRKLQTAVLPLVVIEIGLTFTAAGLRADNLVPATGWVVYPAKGNAAIESNPLCIRVNGADPIGSVRRTGLRLNPESTYRLSCTVKAEGLEGDPATGVQVINSGWTWSSGALKPPQATSQWVDLQQEFRPRTSSDDLYAMVVRGGKKGVLQAKNVRLELIRGDPPAPPPDPGDPHRPYLEENFVVNGGMLAIDGDDEPFPEGWAITAGTVAYDKTGGHGGCPALVFRNPLTQSTVRQPGLPLISGGTYRLTGYYRTKDFDGSGGLFAINNGWTWSGGLALKKTGTVDWTRFEKEFVVPPSEVYQLAFTAKGAGELAICDVRLQGHHPLPKTERPYNIYPISDVLAVDAAKPTMTLGFPYLRGQPGEAELECRLALQSGGAAEIARTASIQGGKAVMSFDGVQAGTFTGQAAVVNTRTKATLCSNRFPVTFVSAPALDLSGVRRLNNLVLELAQGQTAIAAGASQELRFAHPQPGWVFIAVTPSGAADGIRIAIPGAAGDAMSQVEGSTRAVETFRLLPPGSGRILLSARRACTVQFVVRAVPELLFDAPNYNPWRIPLPQLGKSDWAFLEKHVLPACTGFIRGKLTLEQTATVKAAGLRWLTNESLTGIPHGSKGPLDIERSAGFLLSSEAFKNEQFDGLCIDEFILSAMPPRLFADYARVWDRMQRNPGRAKLIYPWVAAGVPAQQAYYADFFSSLARNGGKAIFEAYCRELPTEEQATRELEGWLAASMKAYQRAYPGAQRHMVMGLGVASLLFGAWTQNNLPDVDRKYYIDMQMALLARHKTFRDLYGVAIYTSGHSDEETLRWITRLFRHYAVEGRTEMLSAKYGYTYCPGHLSNGDFADGVHGWTCTAAPGGAVSTGSFKGYGAMQGRWQAQGEGDTFLVLRRGAQKANTVTRQIANLVPGKLYTLNLAVADRAGFDGTAKPTAVALRVAIDGVEQLADKSFSYVLKAGLTRGKARLYPTWRRIVFRARNSTAGLTISDWDSDSSAGGPTGQELVLNFVQCLPYYEE
jgi:hypothetical protein